MTPEEKLRCKKIVDELMGYIDAIVADFHLPVEEEEEELSGCCSAPIIHHDICSSCNEHI